MSTPKQSPQGPPRSTENFGQGQSGYTAGRVEVDPSLKQEARNTGHADGRDEHPHQLDTDDRFTGRGSTRWAPDRGDPGARGDSAEGVMRPEGIERAEAVEDAEEVEAANEIERGKGAEPPRGLGLGQRAPDREHKGSGS